MNRFGGSNYFSGHEGFKFLLGVVIKYLKAYFLIAGYNTATKEEQQYMAEQGIGDFVGRQLMIMAAAPLLGLILKRAGFLWGIEVGIFIFIILVFYSVLAARRFNPPPHHYPPGEFRGKASNTRASVIALAISAVILIGIFGLIFWIAQPAEFILEQNALRITGAYGTVIPYSDIKNVELSNTIPELDKRTNGLSLGSIHKGHFAGEMGEALLFMRSNLEPFIIIQRKESKTVIINLAEPAGTRSLYRQLERKIQS